MTHNKIQNNIKLNYFCIYFSFFPSRQIKNHLGKRPHKNAKQLDIAEITAEKTIKPR